MNANILNDTIRMLTKQESLSADRLRGMFWYDMDTGIFTWKTKTPTKNFVGMKAGCVGEKGYRCISINRFQYKAHRLAWLYVYGRWPVSQIDHINRDKDDNSISNLQEATMLENSRNKYAPKNNTSGYKGVSWSKQSNKWRVKINNNGKYYCIGYFSNINEAAAAYATSAAEHHGKFAITEKRK